MARSFSTYLPGNPEQSLQLFESHQKVNTVKDKKPQSHRKLTKSHSTLMDSGKDCAKPERAAKNANSSIKQAINLHFPSLSHQNEKATTFLPKVQSEFTPFQSYLQKQASSECDHCLCSCQKQNLRKYLQYITKNKEVTKAPARVNVPMRSKLQRINSKKGSVNSQASTRPLKNAAMLQTSSGYFNMDSDTIKKGNDNELGKRTKSLSCMQTSSQVGNLTKLKKSRKHSVSIRNSSAKSKDSKKGGLKRPVSQQSGSVFGVSQERITKSRASSNRSKVD